MIRAGYQRRQGSNDLTITSEQLVAIREKEECAAAARLGVEEVIFPALPGRRATAHARPAPPAHCLIRLKKPDTVVTNDPTARW